MFGGGGHYVPLSRIQWIGQKFWYTYFFSWWQEARTHSSWCSQGAKVHYFAVRLNEVGVYILPNRHTVDILNCVATYIIKVIALSLVDEQICIYLCLCSLAFWSHTSETTNHAWAIMKLDRWVGKTRECEKFYFTVNGSINIGLLDYRGAEDGGNVYRA